MVLIHFLPILIAYQVVKWLGYPATKTVRWTWRREDVPWHHGAVVIMFYLAFLEMFAVPGELVRWVRGQYCRRSGRLAYRTLEPSRYHNAEQMVDELVGRSWRREIIPASFRWIVDSYRSRSGEMSLGKVVIEESDYAGWARILCGGRVYQVRANRVAWKDEAREFPIDDGVALWFEGVDSELHIDVCAQERWMGEHVLSLAAPGEAVDG